MSLPAHRDSARGCVWRRVSAAKHPGAGHRAGSCGDRAGARARAPGVEGQVPRCGAVRGAAVRGDPRRGWRHVSISHGRVNGSAHTSQRRQGQLRTEGVRSDTSANGPGIPRLLPPARSGARLGELGTSRWAQRHRPAPPARIKPGFPPDPARRTVPSWGQTQTLHPSSFGRVPLRPLGAGRGPGGPTESLRHCLSSPGSRPCALYPATPPTSLPCWETLSPLPPVSPGAWVLPGHRHPALRAGVTCHGGDPPELHGAPGMGTAAWGLPSAALLRALPQRCWM